MGFLNTGGLPIPPYVIPAARPSERAINYDFPGFIDCGNFVGLDAFIDKVDLPVGQVASTGASLLPDGLRDGIGCDVSTTFGVWNCITTNTTAGGSLIPVGTKTYYQNAAYTTSSTTGTNAEFTLVVENVSGGVNGRATGLKITNGGYGLPGYTGYMLNDTFTFDINEITGGGSGVVVLTATGLLLYGNGQPAIPASNFVTSFTNTLEANFYVEGLRRELGAFNRINAYTVTWDIENQYFEAATVGVGNDFTAQNYWNTFSGLAVQAKLSDTVVNLPQINSLMYNPTGTNNPGFPEELTAIQPSPVELRTLTYTGSKKFHASTT